MKKECRAFKCNRVLPITETYFHKSNNKLSHYCKRCEGEKKNKRELQAEESRRQRGHKDRPSNDTWINGTNEIYCG